MAVRLCLTVSLLPKTRRLRLRQPRPSLGNKIRLSGKAEPFRYVRRPSRKRESQLWFWLGHSDARQVSDLPKTFLKSKRSMTGSETRKRMEALTASRRLAAHQSGRAITDV